jgi:hypothetical protein
MANYVANNQKKRNALVRREADLLRAMRCGKPTRRIQSLAAKVKSARLGVLRMQLSILPPCAEYDSQIHSMEQAIYRCEEIDLDQIIDEFRMKLSLPGHQE